MISDKKEYPPETLDPLSLLSGQDGNAGRRVLILLGLAGLLGMGGALLYRLSRIPGASELWESGERAGLLKSAITGEPLPEHLIENIHNKKNLKETFDKFDQRLEKLKARDKNFSTAKGKLLQGTFNEGNVDSYLNNLRMYVEAIFSDYRVKSDIPVELVARKINEFPEERVFAIMCCCCGLPHDKGFNYLATAIFKTGYAGLEGKNQEEANYFLKVIEEVTYLRIDWYRNFFDDDYKSPRKNEGLQLIWNFLNAYGLPPDLIKKQEYYPATLG
ncbi:MAG: hypothetical protein HZA01_09695 [Nitrospinae bacterium]|nr:hypothetical protein [Nitrospinota bacterium]